ncbi:MAG: PAS domain S-box protein [Candidatus Krumholzibacteriota bacterium]|nr:PAS domain S-box protein [Candidatus Krumholzibacteriota bacterium]
MAYRVVSPITFNGREIGRVWTVMSLRVLQSKVVWARRFVASMSALLFLIGTGAVILISTLVTNPLRRMVRTVEGITDGDLSQRTAVSSSDEVGQLATAFNVMVNRLQDAQRELEAANCGLEVRVAKRTHELEQQIIERKRAEAGLKASEEQFRFLSEATFEGVAITDEGKVLVANQRLADMLGYELSELVGASTTDFVAPECRDLFLERVTAQDVGPYEHLARRKDGSHFPVEVRANSMSYRGRTVWATVIHDLSQRRQAAGGIRRRIQHLSPCPRFLRRRPHRRGCHAARIHPAHHSRDHCRRAVEVHPVSPARRRHRPHRCRATQLETHPRIHAGSVPLRPAPDRHQSTRCSRARHRCFRERSGHGNCAGRHVSLPQRNRRA